MPPRSPHTLPLVALGLLTLLPLASLAASPSHALADPLSELPVKLWCFEKMPSIGLFGGETGEIGYPVVGAMNNPDPTGVLFTLLTRPLVGRAWAYNLLVWAQLWASAAAVYLLAREVTPSRAGAVLAGVATALTPMMLAYCVTGAVTDMLAVWPYALALRSTLRGLHRPGWRDGALAGLWLAVGFFTCPYNFVVFAALIVPAAPWLLVLWARGPDEGRRSVAQLGRLLLPLALIGGIGVGAYALRIRAITEGSGSHISATVIEESRHAPPFPHLRPEAPDRYTAWLSDYVATGKDALLQRSAGSRYLRAFSPGFVLLGMAGLALVAGGRRRVDALFWLTLAAWTAVVSTGPFLPITATWTIGQNPAWLLAYHVLGGRLILEPFRYALPAAMCLAVAAAIGVGALERLGRWGGIVVVAWIVELVVVSPVPAPLWTTSVAVDPAWRTLGETLPAGAILELPYFDRGTDRFRRVHFLHQLEHGRPIPDAFVGFPPRFLVENQFTAALLAPESRHTRLRVDVTDPARIPADRAALVTAGFGAIVVDPTGYPTLGAYQEVRRVLDQPGEGPKVVYLPGAPP